MVAGVGADRRVRRALRRSRIDHGQQQFLFGTGAVRLRIHHDLVRGIDRGYPV